MFARIQYTNQYLGGKTIVHVDLSKILCVNFVKATANFYTYYNPRSLAFTIPFDCEEHAKEFAKKYLTKESLSSQRLDEASPDSLAISTLEEYENEMK